MTTPVWTTTAGKLASIDEVVAYSLQLEANTADSTALTYSVIAGSLPSGMELTSTGLLTGTPAEVSKRTLYTFVVRATAGTNITDRTFKLDIKGADAPTFTTPSGRLQLDDSTSTGIYWVLDGSEINMQLEAVDTDTATGQTLVYDKIDREECLNIIKEAGYPIPVKSGCFMCPFTKKDEWINLKLNHKDLFDKALALEKIGQLHTKSKKMPKLVRLKGKESQDLFQCDCF